MNKKIEHRNREELVDLLGMIRISASNTKAMIRMTAGKDKDTEEFVLASLSGIILLCDGVEHEGTFII